MLQAPDRHDLDSRELSLLLPTKLSPPVPRQHQVHRRRLIERLAAAPPDSLVLVAAPAGFGKTSLLAAWRATQPATAWVSLDERDNDSSRFWSYIVAALQSAWPGLGTDLLLLLRDRQQ